MNVEGGELYIVRQDGENDTFCFEFNSKHCYFTPSIWMSEDGPYASAMLMTFSIFSFVGDEFEVIKKVYAEHSRLMELYYHIVIHDSRDYPFPKSAIQRLLDLNLTEKGIKIVQQRLQEFIYIYLIKDSSTGFIKIGKSGDPERRLKQLVKQDTLLPLVNDFHIVLCWEDYHYIERVLHERFQDKRVRGEWFDLSAEDIDEIKLKYSN